MKRMLSLLAAVALPFAAALAAEEAETLLREDFVRSAAAWKAGPGTVLAPQEEGRALRIENGMATRILQAPEGETLRFSALVRAENVQKKEKAHWKGTRFAILMGKGLRAGAPVRDGSFDWQRFEFKIDVPLGIKQLELQLGLKDAAGTITFKDVTVEILK